MMIDRSDAIGQITAALQSGYSREEVVLVVNGSDEIRAIFGLPPEAPIGAFIYEFDGVPVKVDESVPKDEVFVGIKKTRKLLGTNEGIYNG